MTLHYNSSLVSEKLKYAPGTIAGIVEEVLINTLALDSKDIIPDSVVNESELGAESIDHLDIGFNLEKSFGIKLDDMQKGLNRQPTFTELVEWMYNETKNQESTQRELGIAIPGFNPSLGINQPITIRKTHYNLLNFKGKGYQTDEKIKRIVLAEMTNKGLHINRYRFIERRSNVFGDVDFPTRELEYGSHTKESANKRTLELITVCLERRGRVYQLVN